MTPPGFEPPPLPHSIALKPVPDSAFLDHYQLFYGAVKATTLAFDVEDRTLVIHQLWRVDNVWQAQDLRDGYPDWSDEDMEPYIGQPIMPDGLHTSVTFTLTPTEGGTSVRVEQDGIPEFNVPIFTNHWRALYLDPLKASFDVAASN